MLPAADHSPSPILSVGAREPLSLILRAQEVAVEAEQHLLKRQKPVPGVLQEGTSKDIGL